ncbi:glutamate racemase [Halospina denitrificans]|uniref:Glutamate racemase n=1 Tax=Halospina denitrificans TaxID=332522 RepID=A0A4R7JLJ8_9GAMM|nr:glutamate racemase [Halospina denitrificans]TDT38524.1 glutamate racemase [Halospina denitrificans]
MPEGRPRILLFDSGMGGLSIARSLWRHLPGLGIVYLADNARFPYGDRSEGEVVERCVALVEHTLAEYPCDVVVVACNTASTVVLPELRARIGQPVVGVVPAIKPAAAMSGNRRIGLLATPATVDRPYLQRLIDDYASDCEIIRVGSSELVRLAEDSLETGAVAGHRVEPILAPFIRGGVDTVVLGCTHFPLIRESLMAAMPGDIAWVDSGGAIARRVEQLLRDMGTAHVSGRSAMEAFLLTGAAPSGLEAWMDRAGTEHGVEMPRQSSRVSLNMARNSSIGKAGR